MGDSRREQVLLLVCVCVSQFVKDISSPPGDIVFVAWQSLRTYKELECLLFGISLRNFGFQGRPAANEPAPVNFFF